MERGTGEDSATLFRILPEGAGTHTSNSEETMSSVPRAFIDFNDGKLETAVGEISRIWSSSPRWPVILPPYLKASKAPHTRQMHNSPAYQKLNPLMKSPTIFYRTLQYSITRHKT